MTDRCQLYLITPPKLEPIRFADRLAASLDAGAVAAVQLRLPEADDATLREAIARLRPVVQSRGVAFLLSQHADLALQTGCDGVHLEQAEDDVAAVRKLVGDSLQLGVSCGGSRERAMLAGEAGADYVAFGAMHASPTKPTDLRAEPSLIAWWVELMELPAVAVGGLTPANCAASVQAGADFLAAISAVWSHPDGEAAGVRAMLAAIEAAEGDGPD